MVRLGWGSQVAPHRSLHSPLPDPSTDALTRSHQPAEPSRSCQGGREAGHPAPARQPSVFTRRHTGVLGGTRVGLCSSQPAGPGCPQGEGGVPAHPFLKEQQLFLPRGGEQATKLLSIVLEGIPYPNLMPSIKVLVFTSTALSNDVVPLSSKPWGVPGGWTGQGPWVEEAIGVGPGGGDGWGLGAGGWGPVGRARWLARQGPRVM